MPSETSGVSVPTGTETVPDPAATPAVGHTGRLVLTTADPHAGPRPGPLLEAMTQMGFIGARLGGQEDAFLVGPDFLSLVAFAGCAVRIETRPGASGALCHVRLPPLAPQPCLYAGRNTRAPRCSGCRGRLSDWRARTAVWRARPESCVVCPHCGDTSPPWCWDWKRQGGFGRRLILIEEVFPGEAVPTQSLLDGLAQVSGTRWRHFYVQD